MPKKTFTSYNYSDAEIARTTRSNFNNNGGPIQGKSVSLEENMTDGGHRAIDNAIKEKMSQCDSALFVVGDNSHNSPWIEREAELAVSKGIPITVTQLPGTTGGIPNALKNIPHERANFSSTDLAKKINHREK